MKKKLYLIISLVLVLIVTSGIVFNLDYFRDMFNPTTLPIVDEHSKLYISGVSVEKVIEYFNEVSLDAEMVNDGDPSKLQKWVEPIYYFLNGKYTAEDLTILNKFTNWLNMMEGFPGIYQTKDFNKANMKIYFGDKNRMIDIMGNNFAGLDGGVTFWYNNDEIYSARIFYRTDIEQEVRNSVIIEEIYNGLGPVQDTDIRTDSIIYSGFSEPQELTKIDELILKLLYNPLLTPGMNKEQCEEVIRNLYY